jgi:preprotein translocase subunit Sss1
MKKPDSIYEIEKKRSGFIAGTVSAWLAVPILLLPLIVSFNDNNPDNNSWRAFAMIVLLGICIVAFSIVLLRYAVIKHCSTISKILLGGACAIHITIIILGIIGFVIRATMAWI